MGSSADWQATARARTTSARRPRPTPSPAAAGERKQEAPGGARQGVAGPAYRCRGAESSAPRHTRVTAVKRAVGRQAGVHRLAPLVALLRGELAEARVEIRVTADRAIAAEGPGDIAVRTDLLGGSGARGFVDPRGFRRQGCRR